MEKDCNLFFKFFPGLAPSRSFFLGTKEMFIDVYRGAYRYNYRGPASAKRCSDDCKTCTEYSVCACLVRVANEVSEKRTSRHFVSDARTARFPKRNERLGACLLENVRRT